MFFGSAGETRLPVGKREGGGLFKTREGAGVCHDSAG